MVRAYTNWQEGHDLFPQQTTGYDGALVDEEAANEVEGQAGATLGHRWGKRIRRHGCRRGKNRNQQEPIPAGSGQDQIQEIAESSPMTAIKREASTVHFWTNATPATLFGFSSNAETLATNIANETRNRSTAEPLFQTDHYQEVYRPVEEGESPFDPDMSYLRATAILGGFVGRRGDVGKKRKDWVREKYIFAKEDEELVVSGEKGRDKVNNNPTSDQIGDQKELTSDGMKKWEWYGKKLRKDTAKDARKAAKREAIGRGGVSSRYGNLVANGRNKKPLREIEAGSARYDHGGFQDTDDYYAEPAPDLKNFSLDARFFESGVEPGDD
ncbi:hypothetical protein AA0113_g2550 [Alternaria arborescens]|uniref:Uncharacterized protein n=1 Tax=Alternaria arborescens TaxID=156630 RepID=A0A4Q4SLJ7_9PLEO|nr:hypothetical protein AA0113_g2550 [Alternaria arborescens]